MSKNSASPFTTSQRQPVTSWQVGGLSNSYTYTPASTSVTKWQSTSNFTHSPTQVDAAGVTIAANTAPTSSVRDEERNSRKRRKLNLEEEGIMGETATAISMHLSSDHILAVHPDVDSPFEDQVDVVNRLLPYHIYQHPKHDLDATKDLKGKAKATEADFLREEIRETKFALRCFKRKQSLQERFRRARIRHGKNTTPHDQMIAITQCVVEVDRVATISLEHELSSARADLERLLRAQRAATMNARQQAQSNAAAFSGHSTIASNSTARTIPHAGYAHYYGAYTYPYGQSNPYVQALTQAGRPATTNQSAPPVTPHTTGAANTPVQPTSNPSQHAPPPTSTPTPAAQPQAQPQQQAPPSSIPVQLPITSLPALKAFGILPVPKAALPPPSQPQPPAVLLGSTNNGTTLLLEINVGLLQATQMSGLAIILSGLMQRTGQAAASTPGAVQTAVDTAKTDASATAGPSSHQKP